MRLGVHVSIAGGFVEALERASRLGCTTMQLFSRSPRGGPAPALRASVCRTFTSQRRQRAITPLIVHSPYIINLASPDRAMFAQSLRLYQEEYARCEALGADYLVTHVGSHRGAGETAGIRRVVEALNRTLTRAKGAVMIVLENTAGAGQGLGDRFEQLAQMRRGVERQERIGICLDTAHLFAAGYAIHMEDGLSAMCEEFSRVVGWEHLKVVHLNDSKAAFDSHVDRHWHIGQGHIGLEAMRRIVTHPHLGQAPLILETPKKTPDDDPRNLAVVRALRQGTALSAASNLR